MAGSESPGVERRGPVKKFLERVEEQLDRIEKELVAFDLTDMTSIIQYYKGDLEQSLRRLDDIEYSLRELEKEVRKLVSDSPKHG